MPNVEGLTGHDRPPASPALDWIAMLVDREHTLADDAGIGFVLGALMLPAHTSHHIQTKSAM